MRRTVLMGALLIAAPLFSQSELFLGETKADVARQMGPPKMTGAISRDFESWQFEAEEMDEGEFSHYVIFGRQSGKVEGLTRNFNPARNVDGMFPAAETVVAELAAGYRGRARRRGDGAWLIAVGSAKAGERVSQVVLMREELLKVFYPAFKTLNR